MDTEDTDYLIGELKDLQRNQQRFDAALAFATKRTWCDSEFTTLPIYEAVDRADELLSSLNDPKLVKWWGWIPTNGTLQVRRFSNDQELLEVGKMPHCKAVSQVVEAHSKMEAIELLCKDLGWVERAVQ
jgi:predicted DNA-binding WGR domain protein